ncbi:hypothetical protein [Croceivirga sp. JEA036]|uniref:hypothetical protein n=1 Tax=Croceivirga sp. JEA036 TaxID=2721162 RepID=UPI001439F000|nr:hypothetical protein [Croceivirga sp. JEA036]NJB37865.1 hypothetical protein [Croceivirga sp. JEA036]
MKAYKIKSLLYLGGFVAAAFVYHNMEQRQLFNQDTQASTVADLSTEDSPEDLKVAEIEAKNFN